MQLLFSLSRDEELTKKDVLERYWKSIDDCFEVYLFNLYIIILIAKEALVDAKKRKAKHLPSDLDRSFSAKLYTNDLIQNLVKNNALQRKFESLNFDSKLNADYIKKIYLNLIRDESHSAYQLKGKSKEDHLEILLSLYRICKNDELFNEMVEDSYSNWTDDKSIVVGTVKKTLKRLPENKDVFFKEYYPDEETVKDFGMKLLDTTCDDDKRLLEVITPTLNNWDSDRVAIIDMILIKMALIELEFFSSIPPKVTLNEYVEVSKMYSTPKSKDFINGILDRLLKDLDKDGKIEKKGRGLIEE